MAVYPAGRSGRGVPRGMDVGVGATHEPETKLLCFDVHSPRRPGLEPELVGPLGAGAVGASPDRDRKREARRGAESWHLEGIVLNKSGLDAHPLPPFSSRLPNRDLLWDPQFMGS